MDTKITLSLNEEMTIHLREEFESRKNQIEKISSIKPGTDKTITRIDNFLATLKAGTELKLYEVQDEDDVDYFLEELIYIIECLLEIGPFRNIIKDKFRSGYVDHSFFV